jgi:hypothetical protein
VQHLLSAFERLARKIAGETADAVALETARAVAQAEFDLARVRQIKDALIQRTATIGELDTIEGTTATVPLAEPERTAEAVRQALPELLKLDRYERRIRGRREQSVLIIIDRIINT